ncbi:linear amide C-N hydrolase [Alkaliphilus pronyensis]|uniref:Linear amide C-N hydrolase n=1 Tax=Alkaliphilus pronyensis TaxID=1482732 RepID=A0A6I0EW52_9FIRM|nr:linear amide C-N hydrolase [Alkaliphilus pronyensis]KAB3531045.1 linear amide C-N hydrolase [Alkaliphilus pronyensis]
MKRFIVLLVVLVIILMSLSCISYACTSFAVYSENSIYGMNFDYPDTEIRLIIYKEEDVKALSMEFKQGDDYLPFAGMNNKGLFVATQLLYPKKPAETKLDEDEIYIGSLGALIGKYEKVEQIEKHIENKKLVNMPITIHKLFADKFGDSIIVEVGDNGNEIVKVNDDFAVMSNFSNYTFKDETYKNVSGVGADRYKIAYEYIKENFNDFNIETGWEVLKKTSQTSGSFNTQCSMIFDPQNQDIYIVVKRDFEKIWKVSLEKETIEPIKGFENSTEIKMSSNGILLSDLTSTSSNSESISAKTYSEVKSNDSAKTFYWILGIGFALIISIIIIGILKNKKSHLK